MKIGIIVYSKTGNTLSVAERIREALTENGLSVTLERFSAETLPQSNTPTRLTATPDPNGYDALILGAPVQAFSLDPAMPMYLAQVGAIKPVPTLCFVTQHFKKPWLGGTHALKQLLALLQKKGVSAESMGVVNWSSEKREEQIAQIAQRCAFALKENRT